MRSVYFLLSVLCSIFVYGQNIKFKTLNTNDGLSNNSVNDMVSDRDGALWIATWDGLNRYDGHRFKVFKHQPGDTTSIPGNMIIQLLRDSNDDIWLFTDNNSVSRYLGNYRFRNYFFKDTIGQLFLSGNGSLVVRCSDDKTYFEYKDRKFVRSFGQNIRQQDNTVLHNILLSKHPDLIINASLRDSEGNIWFATRNNGLYLIPNSASNIHNEQIEHYEYDLYSPYSFTSNEIEKLYEDDFGNVWLCHKDGGVSMAYKSSRQVSTVTPHPVRFPHLPNETIRAITKDFSSHIWLGYYTQGLFYYSPETKCYLKYEIPEAAKNKDWERVRSLFTSSDGSVWAGTYAGLIRIKDEKTTFYSAGDYPDLPNDRNYSLFEDDKRQLWIGCWGGVAKFDLTAGHFEKFKGQEKLSGLHIRKVTVQEDEVMLATENNGIVVLNTASGEISNITVEDGLPGNSTFSIFRDTETQYYWIASLGGISVYDTEKGAIRHITEKDGLPSHMVYSLIPNNDKVWISTTKGIAAVYRADYSVWSLNPEEGWQAAEFSEGAYYQDRKGTLFFGGINGLNYFLPSSIDFSTVLPRLKVVVDNDENPGADIVKNYAGNNLKIDIIPVRYTENTNNKVLYKLSGYDKEWKTFTRSPVFYENLPHRDYVFKVRNSLARNEADDVEIGIRIKKPFYKTGGFTALLLTVLLAMVVYAAVVRNRNARRYQKELEQKIAERTRIIDHQKQDLIDANEKLNEQIGEIRRQKEELLKLHHRIKNRIIDVESDDKELLSPNERLVKKALEIIKTDIQDPTFNVEKLHEKLQISKIKCYRIFKEVLKQSPSDVIIGLRLQKASYLLKNKTLNISEICFECGFNNPKYFSRLFKMHFGYSPRMYKEQNWSS